MDHQYNSTNKPNLIVILGPTAIGKSELAYKLAKNLGCVIINADSIQLYKYFDIGTSKPSKAQLKEVPHHLLNILEPMDEFNAGLFCKTAVPLIYELHKERMKMIIVGGTFLYVRALLHGLIEDVSVDKEKREKLKKLRSIYGTDYLHNMLRDVDPQSADKIHINDYIRIERALEVFYLSGNRLSELQEKHNFDNEKFNFLKIGLNCDREELRAKIDKRVESMIDIGLVEEVKTLRSKGYSPDLKPMKSIGYKEINQYIDNQISFQDAEQLIKRNTKRFAKRQMTWLRKEKDIFWFDIKDYESVSKKIEEFFNS